VLQEDPSKVLQEDPSCQLAAVLRRYIRKVGLEKIELALSSPAIPEIVTLQKGLCISCVTLAHLDLLALHSKLLISFSDQILKQNLLVIKLQ